MRRLAPAAPVFVLVLVMLAACGDDESAPEDSLRGCLENVGYSLEEGESAKTRVSTPAGELVASIHEFETQAEAQRFATRPNLDQVAGGTRVATLTPEANDEDARVIEGCLRDG